MRHDSTILQLRYLTFYQYVRFHQQSKGAQTNISPNRKGDTDLTNIQGRHSDFADENTKPPTLPMMIFEWSLYKNMLHFL